jgi:hypothetical protein
VLAVLVALQYAAVHLRVLAPGIVMPGVSRPPALACLARPPARLPARLPCPR